MSSKIDSTSVRLTGDFKLALINKSTLTMFYVKFREGNTYSGSMYPIATDRIDRFHYVVLLDRKFIKGWDKINTFSEWSHAIFYYSVNGSFVKAFELPIITEDTGSNDYIIYDYAKNILLLDFSDIGDVVCDFVSSYTYNDRDAVPVPVYQHYHKLDRFTDNSSKNALDSKVMKDHFEANKFKNNIDYLPGYENSRYIDNNELKDKSGNSTKLITKTPYTSKLVNNSNQYRIFDNTSINGGYPILTVYGTDIELDTDSGYYILVFEN